jgi:hypothetical protein
MSVSLKNVSDIVLIFITLKLLPNLPTRFCKKKPLDFVEMVAIIQQITIKGKNKIIRKELNIKSKERLKKSWLLVIIKYCL